MTKATIRNLTTGETLTLSRDVRHTHPAWVHDQMGTESEAELQAALDCYEASDAEDECGVTVSE